MKSAIAYLSLTLFLIAADTKAQLNPDSVVNSILPITWNISFDNLDSVWQGSYDMQPDSVIFSYDSDYVFGNNWTWKITLIIDTIDHRISLNLWEGEWGQFTVSQVPYTKVGSKIQAAAYCTDAGNIPEPPGSPDFCIGGWVTLGGATIPSSVLTMESIPPQNFTLRMLSDRTTLFSFCASDGNTIRLFDLLGRMRDEIPIEPQTTNIEYASNRLAPGMYIATLDGNAIKFIVP